MKLRKLTVGVNKNLSYNRILSVRNGIAVYETLSCIHNYNYTVKDSILYLNHIIDDRRPLLIGAAYCHVFNSDCCTYSLLTNQINQYMIISHVACSCIFHPRWNSGYIVQINVTVI